MRRERVMRAERRAVALVKQLCASEVAVTPAFRRKVDDLAVWVSAGDARRVREATRAIVSLLVSVRG